jgi:hypothetical protein
VTRYHPTVVPTRDWWGGSRARHLMHVHSPRHDRALEQIRVVHAASLRADRPAGLQSGLPKQETSEVVASKVSTDPTPVLADGMAASAQSDTGQ